MRYYTMQVPPYPAAPVILPEGFSWGALLFGPLWFLWHGLWLSALGLLAIEAGLSLGMTELGVPGELTAVASLALSVFVAFNARDWWRLMLTQRRFDFAGVVLADSGQQAEQVLLRQAFAVRRRAPTPGATTPNDEATGPTSLDPTPLELTTPAPAAEKSA